MKFSSLLIPRIIFAVIILTVINPSIYGNTVVYRSTPWMLHVDNNDGGISLYYGNRLLVNHSIARWGLNSDITSFKDANNIQTQSEPIQDDFGSGIKVTISGKKDFSTTISQNIYLYTNKDYIFTDFDVTSDNGVQLNFMAPLSMNNPVEIFTKPGNNILFVPYDNDAWVRYRLTPFASKAPESYEVSAVWNSETREGVIIGSIEHDTWKTGIRISSLNDCSIDSLEIYGGAATSLTRDVKAHGAVNGKTVKSPKIMIGRYDDWRDGLESFADICTIVSPQLCSHKEKPLGWNSWGKIQANINFSNASQTSEFFYENLKPATFISSDSTVYIGLDSFWDCGFTPAELKEFAHLCHSRGQKAGIYFCPFTDWIKNGEAFVEEAPQFKYKDIYLYHNGAILSFDGAYAIDPTHPATKKRIEHKIQQFIDWNYDFIKVDFLAHGAYEADKYFDPEVTTGVQAYNQGMAFLNAVVNDRLWINLSIAPLFPANYAHSRRIGCDAWADIKNTEYTLNALTYGWWLDHLYHYNDADHIVMEGVSDGENRARLTSSAITGVFFLGDDLSHSITEETKNKVLKVATNPDINEMARRCKSFRPVENGIGDGSADMFYFISGDTMYVAAFNFSDSKTTKEILLNRMGLQPDKEYLADELWSHTQFCVRQGYKLEIPSKDVKVLRINLSEI